jgi:hypothetical protein
VPVTDRDKGYSRRVKAILTAGSSPTVTYVGVLGDKASAAHKESGLTVGDLAEIHEFGVFNPEEGIFIQERSFLRAWFDAERDSNLIALRAAHRQVLLGKLTPQQAGNLIGLRFVGQIQKWIADNKVKPPSSDETNARKGSSVTLIDTGQLRAAISYLVETRLVSGPALGSARSG